MDNLIISLCGLMIDYYARDVGKQTGPCIPETVGKYCNYATIWLLERLQYRYH